MKWTLVAKEIDGEQRDGKKCIHQWMRKQHVMGLKCQSAGRKLGDAGQMQARMDVGQPLPGLAGHQAPFWKILGE